MVIHVSDGGLLVSVAGFLVNLVVDRLERRFDRLLVVLRHCSHLVVWPAAVVNRNPRILLLNRLLIFNNFLRLIIAIPEVIMFHYWGSVHVVHDRAILMAIVLAPVVGFVSWVNVEVRFVSFMFVPIALILMVLEVLVEHATVRVLFL